MPSLEEHIEKSVLRTGKSWKELHEFLDGRGLSMIEKIRRHSIFSYSRNLSHIKKTFGDDGVEEYIHHLKEDYGIFPLSVIFKIFEKIKIGR